jgi:hypothetical protein
MKIVAHRGYWKSEIEKNSITSFRRALSLNFGIETDVRDYCDTLVISHDIPSGNEVKFDEFCNIYKLSNSNQILAINIKSDGLQRKIKESLINYNINNFFLFDMSIPDSIQTYKQQLPFFCRQSEYEQKPSLYNEASGVWIDEFKSHWITENTIKMHLENNKKICIVSPELHNREYEDVWLHYRLIEKNLKIDSLMICTDYPKLAEEFFNE